MMMDNDMQTEELIAQLGHSFNVGVGQDDSAQQVHDQVEIGGSLVLMDDRAGPSQYSNQSPWFRPFGPMRICQEES